MNNVTQIYAKILIIQIYVKKSFKYSLKNLNHSNTYLD